MELKGPNGGRFFADPVKVGRTIMFSIVEWRPTGHGTLAILPEDVVSKARWLRKLAQLKARGWTEAGA